MTKKKSLAFLRMYRQLFQNKWNKLHWNWLVNKLRLLLTEEKHKQSTICFRNVIQSRPTFQHFQSYFPQKIKTLLLSPLEFWFICFLTWMLLGLGLKLDPIVWTPWELQLQLIHFDPEPKDKNPFCSPQKLKIKLLAVKVEVMTDLADWEPSQIYCQ